MKSLKKILVVAFLSLSMFFVTACSWFDKPVEVATETGFNFNQGTVIYERNETFSVNGTQIVLTMSDGTTKPITLTDSMIKVAPDMTTAGLKTAVITINGKDYTITFTVLPNGTDTYTTQLQSFLAKYNAGEIDLNSITASASVDLDYTFLQNVGNVDEGVSQSLTTEQLLQLLSGLQNDGAASDLYDILLDSIVNSSLTLQGAEQVSSTQRLAGYNLDIFFGMLGEKLSTADYRAYFVKNVLQKYSAEIETMVHNLVESSFVDLSDVSYNEISDSIMTNVYDCYISNNRVDVNALLDEIIEIIHDDQEISIELETAYTTGLTTLRNGNVNNTLSELIEAMAAYYPYKAYNPESQSWEYYDSESTDDLIFKQSYYHALSQLVKVVEDLYKNDLQSSLDQMIIHLNSIYNYQVYLDGNYLNLWPFLKAYDVNEAIKAVTALKDAVNGDFEAVDGAYHISDMVIDEIAQMLVEEYYNSEITEQTEETVKSSVVSFLQGEFTYIKTNHSLDIIYFVHGIGALLPEFDQETYTQNFYTYGTPRLFTVYVNNELDDFLDREHAEHTAEEYAEIETKYEGLRAHLNEVTIAVDSILTLQNNVVVYHNNFLAIEDGIHNLFEYSEENGLRFQGEPFDSAMVIFFDSTKTLAERAKTFLETYQENIANMVPSMIGIAFDMPYSEQLSDQIYDWAYGFIGEIINGTVNIQTSFTDLFEIIDLNASSNSKAIAYSTLALVSFFMDNVDYNALFAQIELPEEIASVDFNALVATLKSEQTYTDIFNLSNVNVVTQVDGNGQVVKEIITLTLDVDFDIMVSTITGQLNVALEINF